MLHTEKHQMFVTVSNCHCVESLQIIQNLEIFKDSNVWLQMKATESLVTAPLIATVDWLHIIWRLRVQFLDPACSLHIGPFFINPRALKRCQERGNWELQLLYSDLNNHDKQNYTACLRLFDFEVRSTTASFLREIDVFPCYVTGN